MESFGAERWFCIRARNRCPPVEKNSIPRSRLILRAASSYHTQHTYLPTRTFNVWFAYAYTYI